MRMACVQVLETVSVFELFPCTGKMIISCGVSWVRAV